MATSGLIRLGGLAAMVGGVVYTALGLLVPFLAPLLFSLLVLGATAAIAALHVLQRGRYGLPGALASLTAFVGLAVIIVSNLGLTEGLPWPLPERIFVVGQFTAALGMVALGTAVVAARVLPWWCGAALVVGGLGLISQIIVVGWMGFFTGLLAGVAWALVGYSVFRVGARQAQQPPRVR